MSQPEFEASYEQFAELVGFMAGDESAGLSHGELEQRLATEGRELLRQLFQDHLDLRAANETPIEGVADATGAARPYVEVGHTRALLTVFGEVVVDRYAYRAKHQAKIVSAMHIRRCATIPRDTAANRMRDGSRRHAPTGSETSLGYAER